MVVCALYTWFNNPFIMRAAVNKPAAMVINYSIPPLKCMGQYV